MSRWCPKELYYGGDYNPEQWGRQVWAEDAEAMVEAGVNLVTVGVFAWAKLEPAPGEFDFGWLGDVLDLLHRHAIGVDLATATASPPPWMARAYPDSLPVDEDGHTLWPGGRQHYCPSNPDYRRHATHLARRLAEEMGEHPALRMWHVNNEYGCHVSRCYCDASASAFREWLERRYGSLDALNEAWGTSFWSQHYGDWQEVLPPRKAPTIKNPTQALDFARFSSDELLGCFQAEVAALRAVTPQIPVTTNFMGFFKPLDYNSWARLEDFTSTDDYPDPADPDRHLRSAAHYDLIRSLKKGQPWLLMEQTTTRVNWRARNVAKAPGEMRRASLKAVARGSEGAMFFQWRASLSGAEKFHGAMLPHAGKQAPSWQEVVALGAELRALEELAGSTVVADVAMCFDWENWWALEAPSKPADDVRMLEQVEWCYRPLFDRNLTVDFCHPQEPLGGYPLVVVPSLYLMSEASAANLRSYVEGGGTAVVSFWSGVVDEHDHVRAGPYGSLIADLLGAKVLDVSPPAPGSALRVQFHDGTEVDADLWADVIALDGAETLAAFAGGALDGRPAVTRQRSAARGSVFYLGTRLDHDGTDAVFDLALGAAGVSSRRSGPAVEVVRRHKGDTRYRFVLNHGNDDVDLGLGEGDTVIGAAAGSAWLPPGGAAVIRETSHDR